MRRPLRTGVALLAIAAAALLAGCGGSGDGASTTTAAAAPPAAAKGPTLDRPFGSMDQLPGILTTPPPWGANQADLRRRLQAVGLPALTEEGEVVHIHQHLDVFVDGKPVEIPPDIGIAADQSFISPLHTHQGAGDIIHIESPTASSFSLGQFFAVWGVRLDERCIGAKCAKGDKQLRAWVNGKPVNGDPTAVVLEEHQEIVVAYGTAAQMPDPVPSSYEFPGNL